MGLKKALKIAAVWAKLSSEISEHFVSKNGYMNWFCYTFVKRLFELLETLIQVNLAFTFQQVLRQCEYDLFFECFYSIWERLRAYLSLQLKVLCTRVLHFL